MNSLDKAIRAIDAPEYSKKIPEWVQCEEPKMKKDGSYAVDILRKIKGKMDEAERAMKSSKRLRQQTAWQEYMNMKHTYDYVARKYVD